jgi:hypothetical protein
MHIPSVAAIFATGLSLFHAAPAATAHYPSAPPTSTSSSTIRDCADGRWVGPDGISLEGMPDRFDPGDRGAVYLWHDASGWHLRTTDATPGPHLYTGTIAASAGVRFTYFAPVRLERDDHVWVTGDNVLHYSLKTYRGVDGFNFRVSACGLDRSHETLGFSMDYNGHEDDASRINLGDSKRHPDSATFKVSRTV